MLSPLADLPDLEALRRQWLEWAAEPMKGVAALRQGMTWDHFQSLSAALGLSPAVAAGVLQIPPRTLARRKGGRLDLNEGERLLRLVRLTCRAMDVLGAPEKAHRWLKAPNGALGGVAPLSLLDTDLGTQAAEAVLGRIEYGVFS